MLERRGICVIRYIYYRCNVAVKLLSINVTQVLMNIFFFFLLLVFLSSIPYQVFDISEYSKREEWTTYKPWPTYI